jgi:Ca2+-binding EF-hand superfamily protein
LGVLEKAYKIMQASGSFESRRNSIEALEAAALSTVTHKSPSPVISAAASNALGEIVESIFRTIDRNNNGIINVEDAEKTLLRLNSRLGRRYGEDDVRAFFSALDVNNDGTLDLNEFKRAFINIAS